MGVLGLTPFLLKHCPQVIKKLPDRLRSLGGKTIVIDGTLITQRLHFASIPYTHRHVLGWYNILQELKESDVGVICVFDGRERNKAKARETARRQEVRKQSQARGSLETDRLKRLHRLVGIVEQIRSSDLANREETLASLRGLVSGLESPQSTCDASQSVLEAAAVTPASLGTSLVEPDSLDHDHEDTGGLPIDQYPASFGNVLAQSSQLLEDSPVVVAQLDDMDIPLDGGPTTSSDISPMITAAEMMEKSISDEDLEALFLQIQTPRPAAGENAIAKDRPEVDSRISPSLVATEDDETPSALSSIPDDGILSAMDDVSGVSPAPSVTQEDHELLAALSSIPTRDIPSALAALYSEYCKSIPQAISLDPSLASVSEAHLSSNAELDVEGSHDQSEYAMSKHQLQLMLEEGLIWDELVNRHMQGDGLEPCISVPHTISDAPQDCKVQVDLASLAERSTHMSHSYDKRNNAPTAETYEESKEIIRALGIPCVESIGAYEAEALAASLVLNGHADYVASEDTDVVVYEAPLIRGITSRSEALTVVSGSEVRTELELDRARFIDFAVLMGTDFSQRIKNVGPTRALKFIREHGSIEQILKQEPKYAPPETKKVYMKQVKAARLVFKTLPPVPDPSTFQQGEHDQELVAEILQRHGLHRAVRYEWQHETALEGNYFQDNPSAGY